MFFPNRAAHPFFHEKVVEFHGFFPVHAPESMFIHGIVGNQIHVGCHAPKERCQLLRMFGSVIDSLEQNVFEGEFPVVFPAVVFQGFFQFLQRIGPVDGHEL